MMIRATFSILLLISLKVYGQSSPRPTNTFTPQDLLELFSEGFGDKYADYTVNFPSTTTTPGGTEIVAFPREECFDSNLVFEIRRKQVSRGQKTYVTLKCVIGARFSFSILRIGDNLVPQTVEEIVNFQLPRLDAQEELVVTYAETGLQITVLHPRPGYTRMNYELRSDLGSQYYFYTEALQEDGSWTWKYESHIEQTQQRHLYQMKSHPVDGSAELYESDYFVNGGQVFFPREFFSGLEEIFTEPIESYFESLDADFSVIEITR